jgi:hypothetical protein
MNNIPMDEVKEYVIVVVRLSVRCVCVIHIVCSARCIGDSCVSSCLQCTEDNSAEA